MAILAVPSKAPLRAEYPDKLMTIGHFKNKVAIVTGGASGIGRALCEALYRCGAHVIVADIDKKGAQDFVAAMSSHDGSIRAAHLDVTDLASAQKLATETFAGYGRIDYMFNNAAATATRGELNELPPEIWHRAIEVNLLGVVNGSMVAYAVMKQQGFGHIVNMASLAGLVGYPTNTPYSATKAAVINLSVSLRMEAASSGVNVSAVCPGPVHGDAQYPLRLIGIDRAAQLILTGTAKNRSIIVFPLHARILWWLYRISPNLVFPIGRKLARDFLRKRTEPADP